MLRKSVAKMKGKQARLSTGTTLGRVAKLSRKSSGLSRGSGCSGSTNPPDWIPQKCHRPEGPETAFWEAQREHVVRPRRQERYAAIAVAIKAGEAAQTRSQYARGDARGPRLPGRGRSANRSPPAHRPTARHFATRRRPASSSARKGGALAHHWDQGPFDLPAGTALGGCSHRATASIPPRVTGS
jgi:hypothetical protein